MNQHSFDDHNTMLQGAKHENERRLKTCAPVKQKGKWLLPHDRNTIVAAQPNQPAAPLSVPPVPAYRPSDEGHNKGKNRRTNYGPDDGERFPANRDRKKSRQSQFAGQPHANVGANKANHNGNKTTAQIIAGQRLPDGAADGGNQQKNQKLNKCHCLLFTNESNTQFQWSQRNRSNVYTTVPECRTKNSQCEAAVQSHRKKLVHSEERNVAGKR